MWTTKLWLFIGFLGQFLFAMRFIWQWIQSEKQRKSVVPIHFWYFSLGGGIILTLYAIHRKDLVFTIGQASGLIVYIRNLYLIYHSKNLRS